MSYIDPIEPSVLKRRIQGSLARLLKMRQLDAPLLVVRTEQLMLWAMRQQRKGHKGTMREVPGWDANYTRFVLVHHGSEFRN